MPLFLILLTNLKLKIYTPLEIIIKLAISNTSFLRRPATFNYHNIVNRLSSSKYTIILGQGYLRDLPQPLFAFPSCYIAYISYTLELERGYLQGFPYSYLRINFNLLIY